MKNNVIELLTPPKIVDFITKWHQSFDADHINKKITTMKKLMVSTLYPFGYTHFEYVERRGSRLKRNFTIEFNSNSPNALHLEVWTFNRHMTVYPYTYNVQEHSEWKTKQLNATWSVHNSKEAIIISSLIGQLAMFEAGKPI